MVQLRDTTGEEIQFQARLRVGRAPGNDLRINLATVSSDHAVLEIRDGNLHVRDLGSTNGTRVKGRRIVAWTKLAPGDVVRFGPDSAWEVVSMGASDDRRRDSGAGTPAQTLPERGGDQIFDLELKLTQQGPAEGQIEIRAGDQVVRFDGATNRFFLLLVLANQALAASAAEDDLETDWISDDRLRVALWGRSGADSRAMSALHKVIYDTRRMIAARGVDSRFIEKSRGRTRLRLDPARIVVEDGRPAGP